VVGSGAFGRLVVVHTVTNAADALFTVSLAGSLFFSVSADAARPRILLYLLLTLAPFAVLAPFVAPVVDHFRGGYRFVILVTAAGRCAACAALAVTLNTLLFFPEAFAVLVLGRTYSVAKSSLVARLVDDERRLVASNARLARLGIVGGVVGGAAGAGLVYLSSPVAAAAGAAIAHAGAVVVAWHLPRAQPPGREPSGLEEAELHQTRLTLAAAATAVLRGAVGFVTFFVALVLKTTAEPAWVYGVALLAGGIGGFVGTVVAGPLRHRLEEQSIVVTCLGGLGIVSFVAIAVTGRVSVSVLALSVTLAATAGRQAFDSLTQRLAPDAEKGRAFAGFEMRFELAWVGGAIIAVTFEPSLSVGLVTVGGLGLAASLVYELRLRQLRGAQLSVPISGSGEADRLASTVVAMARAAGAQGADRLAIVLAHEAVQLCSLADGVGVDETIELGRLWRQAASPGPLEPGAAGRAIDLAAWVVTVSTSPPSR
jgi:predicted MFS family arabinose efflux permease